MIIDGLNNRVGGAAAGEGNLIAYNNQFGVYLGSGAGPGNVILGNAIVGNIGHGHRPGE